MMLRQTYFTRMCARVRPSLVCLSVCPTLEEVRAFCDEARVNVNPQKFFDYYDSRGWSINGRPIRDFKALLRSWSEHERKPHAPSRGIPREEDYYYPGYNIDDLIGSVTSFDD